jgi:hypothetical protein
MPPQAIWIRQRRDAGAAVLAGCDADEVRPPVSIRGFGTRYWTPAGYAQAGSKPRQIDARRARFGTLA